MRAPRWVRVVQFRLKEQETVKGGDCGGSTHSNDAFSIKSDVMQLGHRPGLYRALKCRRQISPCTQSAWPTQNIATVNQVLGWKPNAKPLIWHISYPTKTKSDVTFYVGDFSLRLLQPLASRGFNRGSSSPFIRGFIFSNYPLYYLKQLSSLQALTLVFYLSLLTSSNVWKILICCWGWVLQEQNQRVSWFMCVQSRIFKFYCTNLSLNLSLRIFLQF